MRMAQCGGRDSLYEIQVAGRLESSWLPRIHGLISTAETRCQGIESTWLRLRVPDQPALRGVLNGLWDLNLALLSVRRVEAVPEEEISHDG